ncbi:MAG TPA: hypothetical protein VNY05_41345 [Candidatus Acidoferrales bacterium]|jgi:hypothetical protein|nr:hypothetical protein [Candidatus Acidoferrales bacterium]
MSTEAIIAILKHLLDFAPKTANDRILREEYEEQIELANPDDPDEIAMHRDRALELLAWRGARVAIDIFSRIDVAQYMSSVRGEDLAIVHCGATLHARFRDLVAIDPNNEVIVPVTLPIDDGLAGIPGLIKLEDVSPKEGWITLWVEWIDLLGEPPRLVNWPTAVSSALSQARKEVLLRAPDLSCDQARKSLADLLGSRLDRLCPASDKALVATEQIRLLNDFADPGTATMCVGRAVECQLRYQAEKRFRPYKTKKGSEHPLTLLWKKLYPGRNTNLGDFIGNLGSLSAEEAADFKREWTAPPDAREILSKFNVDRNRAVHGPPQPKSLADQIVGNWLDCTQQPDAKRLWSVLTPE